MPKKSQRQSAVKASVRRDLFGPPPILDGEDPNAYNEILDRVFNAVGPTDFIDEILVHDSAMRLGQSFAGAGSWLRLLSDQVQKRVNNKRIACLKPKPSYWEVRKRKTWTDFWIPASEFSCEDACCKVSART